MKNYVIYFMLIISISNKSISSVETYEENYSCALDMLVFTSLLRYSTLENENSEIREEALKENILWEAISLSYMKQKEQDITKRRDMLSKNVIERLTETLKENEPEKVFSAKFVEEKIEGCFGDTELQRVYNLFYAGIKDYG